MRVATRAGAPLAFAAIAATTAGCAHRNDPAVVRFWAMGREGEVVVELLAEFERTHPGIRVEVQQLPWSAAHEKLLTAFAGDSTITRAFAIENTTNYRDPSVLKRRERHAIYPMWLPHFNKISARKLLYDPLHFKIEERGDQLGW